MKNKVFEGCATALITPFDGGKIDYASFEDIVERQIAAGVSALVFSGTTGEAPTLSESEWRDICSFAVKSVGGRARVIVGCGSNSTAEAAKRAARAAEAGADALLVVSPYYNKGNKEGIVRHYKCVCSAAEIPVIAYNVPSRTGVDLDLPVCREISKIPNMAGIKEASGSASRAACLMSYIGDDLPLYSGSDEINLPVLSVGGSGIISVVSNVFPEQCTAMCRSAVSGDIRTARELSSALYPFTVSLFCEVNPIPVKTVLSYMGLCREEFRLPVYNISEENRKRVVGEYERTARFFN